MLAADRRLVGFSRLNVYNRDVNRALRSSSATKNQQRQMSEVEGTDRDDAIVAPLLYLSLISSRPVSLICYCC